MTTPHCPGPASRREFLQIGALAVGGLGLAEILRGRAVAGESRRDTSVIMLYLNGGPSQLETYDLKPDAPIEYRSVFAPIQTSVSGMDICELFPLQARLADKFSLIRSLNHDVGIHSDGGIVVLTGKRPTQLDPTSQSKSEHPDFGSVTSKIRGTEKQLLPQYVSVPRKPYMTRPTYLGLHCSAFETGDPSAQAFRPPGFALAVGRDGKGLDDRKNLLEQLDSYRRATDSSEQLGVADKFRALAYEMLTSPQTAAAFDLSREEEAVRDRYGRHLWGQGCLLARRLAEAGTAVISVDINTPKSGEKFTNWDDHIANAGRPGHFAEYMKVRLPYMDQALSALIEDVFERGLGRRVLIVVMGEFGRTPRLSRNTTGVGRDHWPQAYSALVSGGGFRMGQVIGATNAKSEFPTERPYSPQDLLATIYLHLGIDPSRQFVDFMGRPVSILPHGSPIRELL